MSNQQIRCTVVSCHYWEKGNLCKANEILVTSNYMADSLPEGTDAPQADQVTQTPVAKCAESCCKTFVPRNSFHQNLDGVLKETSE